MDGGPTNMISDNTQWLQRLNQVPQRALSAAMSPPSVASLSSAAGLSMPPNPPREAMIPCCSSHMANQKKNIPRTIASLHFGTTSLTL